MKELSEHLNESLNEGLIGSSISLVQIRKIDPEHLLTGILNMYDYICDGEDIKLFYQDYPIKERLFWENLYKLYTKNIWSIFDVGQEESSELNLQPGLSKVTPEFRRNLRQMIKNSRNSKLDVKPGQIESLVIVKDKVKNTNMVLTINKIGFFRGLLRTADFKLLKSAFEKLAV